jgi:hypothetical protein
MEDSTTTKQLLPDAIFDQQVSYKKQGNVSRKSGKHRLRDSNLMQLFIEKKATEYIFPFQQVSDTEFSQMMDTESQLRCELKAMKTKLIDSDVDRAILCHIVEDLECQVEHLKEQLKEKSSIVIPSIQQPVMGARRSTPFPVGMCGVPL